MSFAVPPKKLPFTVDPLRRRSVSAWLDIARANASIVNRVIITAPSVGVLHWSILTIGLFDPRGETFAFYYFPTVASTQEALPARDFCLRTLLSSGQYDPVVNSTGRFWAQSEGLLALNR
jgi:hypothetical protein